jgi:hypothetical protein
MRRVFWVVLLAILLAWFELCSFALTKLRPDLFDQREAFLSHLRSEDFERFKQQAASNTLGWDNPAGQIHREQNCIGIELTYTYDQDRLRVHDTTPARDAVILISGDSYTHGNDVTDSETFPASLQRILQVPVANFGVGGYDPYQALLKLEGLIDRFPRARVVVLAIMYENVRRIVNGYRPVYLAGTVGPIYLAKTDIRFGLKPYVLDGEFHGLMGDDPFSDFPSMLAAANVGFDTDFWHRAQARFPYSAALIEAVLLPSFYVKVLDRFGGRIGWTQWEATYHLGSTQRNLRAIYDRFARLAQSRNLHAVIVFIPKDGHDQTSGLLGIATATEVQRAQLTFINVGREFEWPHFRGPCSDHPSPDGYQMIATDVARTVGPLMTLSGAN